MTDNKLFIIRGLPGSGKTTYANKLKSDGTVQEVVEADQFMTDSSGNYKFDASLLQKYHQMCQMWTRYYLDKGLNVAVANTFSRKWEIIPYTRMGYTFEIIEMQGSHKNIHGVPDAVIKQMKNRWEIWK